MVEAFGAPSEGVHQGGRRVRPGVAETAPLAACAAGADATTSPKPKAMTMRHAILRLLQTGTEGRPKHGINEA